RQATHRTTICQREAGKPVQGTHRRPQPSDLNQIFGCTNRKQTEAKTRQIRGRLLGKSTVNLFQDNAREKPSASHSSSPNGRVKTLLHPCRRSSDAGRLGDRELTTERELDESKPRHLDSVGARREPLWRSPHPESKEGPATRESDASCQESHYFSSTRSRADRN